MRTGFAALLMTLSAWSPATAEDLKSFTDAMDTRFSVQFIKSRPGKKDLKLTCTATYKILDVQQMPDMQTKMLAGDVLELSYPCDKHHKPAEQSGTLPWAEVKSDGMLEVHIPNKYLKKREVTSAETYWYIDNSSKQFTAVKQTKIIPAYKTER